MARSTQSVNKKERAKKQLQNRKDKEQKKQERKASASKGKSLDEMMAYVDEQGNITSTPPSEADKPEDKKSSD